MSQQINLFNPIFLKQKKHFSATTMAQALALILAGYFAMYAYMQVQLSRKSAEAQETAAQLTKTRDQFIMVTTQFSPQKNGQVLEEEIRKAQADLTSMQSVFNALHSGEFGDTKGYSNYFRGFSRQIVNGLWLTGVSIVGSGHNISLRGRALNPQLVPIYLTRLRSEPDMQGKSFSDLEMQMPQSESIASSEAKPEKAPASPGYIEFNLQSSAFPPEGSPWGKLK